MATTIKLPQNVWHAPREIALPLPDGWQVKVQNFAGHARPPMTPEQIKAAVARPIGMPPLREFARGRKEAVIIFDDMTRSTPISAIAPFVLEELAAAGFTDDRIRFVAALGTHGALDRLSMAKKLGDEIIARFPVYNHSCFLHCAHVGTTSFGTEVEINSEVMSCDLKISIAEVVPHIGFGFGGGGKIIMPGVCSFETIKCNHSRSKEEWEEKRRALGAKYRPTFPELPNHAEVQEIARMAGLDMIVNCLVNGWGEPVDVFAGAMDPAYEAAVAKAKEHYLTENTRDSEIVIANNYVKSSEIHIAWAKAHHAVREEGGDVVLVANSATGQVVHFLFDRFGKDIKAAVHRPMTLPPNVRNLIIYTDFPERRIIDRFAEQDRVHMTGDWNEVIARLEKSHGPGARVTVYPNADIHLFGNSEVFR